MQDINAALVQLDLVWENKKANLEKFDKIFANEIPDKTDLIVIPEMFTTGFSMNPEKNAEEMDGATMQWMSKHAKEKNAVITGSIIISENNNFYNRLIWMRPDGTYETYDKRHLFTLAGEQNHYQAGNKKLIVDFKGWKVAPFICYDLRFPVWIRNKEDYNLIVLVANWPQRRALQWESLLFARAIENQSFLLAVNRIGNDFNDVYHTGESMAISPIGKFITKATDIETVLHVKISAQDLMKARKQMPFLNDRDNFEIV